jgi:DNA-binding NarL/FixJ family response regulator
MSTIMIIENNAEFCQTLINLLNSNIVNLKFLEASNGEEAFKKIEELVPDIIFIDINLPGESGLKVTKKIRKIYPEVILISMSSYDLSEYREAAEQHGANYFLSKSSFDVSEMLEVVDSFIS